VLLNALDKEKFTWGRAELSNMNETRKTYIDALRAADRQDYTSLLQFVHS
jgi:hypothetical protein